MPTIVAFAMFVDDLQRAKKFYEKLFDWKINQISEEPMPYYFIGHRLRPPFLSKSLSIDMRV